jgi:hypothetical protein
MQIHTSCCACVCIQCNHQRGVRFKGRHCITNSREDPRVHKVSHDRHPRWEQADRADSRARPSAPTGTCIQCTVCTQVLAWTMLQKQTRPQGPARQSCLNTFLSELSNQVQLTNWSEHVTAQVSTIIFIKFIRLIQIEAAMQRWSDRESHLHLLQRPLTAHHAAQHGHSGLW